MDEIAGTLTPECGTDPLILCGPSPLDEAPLSRFERLAVRLGAWAGGVAERWAFSSGPFFAFDGRPIALCAHDVASQPAPPDVCPSATPDA